MFIWSINEHGISFAYFQCLQNAPKKEEFIKDLWRVEAF